MATLNFLALSGCLRRARELSFLYGATGGWTVENSTYFGPELDTRRKASAAPLQQWEIFFSLHYCMILPALTIGFAILVLIYHQVTTMISLFPWNDTSKYTKKEIITEAGSNGLLMGIGVLCLLLPNKGFYHFYPLFYYPFLFAGEIFQWWLPYFSDKFSKMMLGDEYEIRFARTTKLFKSRNGKQLPDANHTFLHVLTVITLILVFVDRMQ